MEQLSGEPLLLMNESFRLYHDFTACCALRGIEPNIVAKTADGAGLYRLCSQKVGLAVAPEFFREEFQMRGMKLLPFAGDEASALCGEPSVGNLRGAPQGDGGV